MNDVVQLVDRAVATIVAAAPAAPSWEQVVARRGTPRPRRVGAVAAASGLVAAATIAAIVVLPRRGDEPGPLMPTVSQADPSTVSTEPTVPLRPIRGAALPSWLPEGLVIWDVEVGNGQREPWGGPGRLSDVMVGSADDPFANNFGIIVEPAEQTLDERFDMYTAAAAEQPEQFRATIEIATIAGQPRLVRRGGVGGRIVEWIDNGVLIGVWDSNALSDEVLERVVAGVAFRSPGEAWAAQRAASDHIATMPLAASAAIDGETVELRTLDQAGARALCAVDRSDVRRCRLLVDEGSIAGTPTGDVIVAIDDGTTVEHTYGWISVPASLDPYDPTLPIVLEVVDEWTWFRIDAASGTGSVIDVDGLPRDTGQFVLNFAVGDADAQMRSICLRKPDLDEDDGCPPSTTA